MRNAVAAAVAMVAAPRISIAAISSAVVSTAGCKFSAGIQRTYNSRLQEPTGHAAVRCYLRHTTPETEDIPAKNEVHSYSTLQYVEADEHRCLR